jgi:hypothetical protein
MKKVIMSFIGAMMILSLAACTPTTEKTKTSAESKKGSSTEASVKTSTTELVSGVDYERGGDSTAPDMDIVVIYTVKSDGSGLESTMESVDSDEMSEQSLVDLLAQNGVLNSGSEIIDFDINEDEDGAAVVGPGVDASETSCSAVLNLNDIPGDGKDELIVHAIARTFIENLDIEKITVQLNGEVVAEGLTADDVE